MKLKSFDLIQERYNIYEKDGYNAMDKLITCNLYMYLFLRNELMYMYIWIFTCATVSPTKHCDE
jgi:hypothetical protein